MSSEKHHDLEAGLMQAVQGMRQKQRRSRLRAAIVLTLSTALGVAVVALVTGGSARLATKPHEVALVVVAGIGLCALVLRCVWLTSAGMARLPQGWPAGVWRMASSAGSERRGWKIRRRSFVGLILLLLALLYQHNPALLHHPIQALYTEIRYRPRPPPDDLPMALDRQGEPPSGDRGHHGQG